MDANIPKAVFAIAFVMAVATLISQSVIKSYIKRFHSEVWRQLGSPGMGTDSISSSMKFGKFFIRSRAYKSLNDKILDRKVLVSKILGIVTLVLLVMTFALAALAAIMHD